MEQKKTLKDNLTFRYSIIAVCVAIMVGFRFIQTPSLSTSAWAVIGTFLGTLILWLTISIDWPSLLCILSLGIIPELGFKSLFTASFGSDTFVFLLCTFICTYALSKTNIIKKVAIWFVSNKLAKKGPWFFTSMFFFGVIFLGMFISPSVLFVVLLPILEQIYEVSKIEKGSKVGNMLMIGMAFTVSISSGMTPIAHVFPVISMNALAASFPAINYASYMAIAIPAGIVITILMILMFRIFLRPDMTALKNVNTDELKKDIQKLDKRDYIILSIFIVMILLWILPSILQNALPDFYKLINGYTTAFPAIIGVVLLCSIQIDHKPLVSISDACKNGVPFASLFMLAGTQVISSALTNSSIGISDFLKTSLSSTLGGLAPIILVIIFAVWAVVQTNVSSNMVTATVVSSVCMAIMPAVTTGPMLYIAITIIGMLSAFAFATPPSMPHIAIAAASDYSNTKSALIYGSILALISVVISVLLGCGIGLLVF